MLHLWLLVPPARKDMEQVFCESTEMDRNREGRRGPLPGSLKLGETFLFSAFPVNRQHVLLLTLNCSPSSS